MQEPVISLRDPADWSSFRVIAPRANRGVVRDAVSEAGMTWVDDDHVAVPEQTVRTLAGPTASAADWEDGFSNMLRYAETKGWLSAAGIRAHVAWSDV
jgi:hypothetical protein